MNNLYRELAPVTEAAWAEIELEAGRTFKRHIAGRRVVDVSEPGGPVSAAVSTGHLLDVAPPADGVVAHLREARPLVRLRVPFHHRPPRHRRCRARFAGFGLGSGQGTPPRSWRSPEDRRSSRVIRRPPSRASRVEFNPALTLPEDPRDYPDVIAQALSEHATRRCGRAVLVAVSADAYTLVSETTAHGYPLREHHQQAGRR
jgi:uncharacterized linocin/CFP29 family protein